MYRYETHLHTAPVSKCGWAGVRETLLYYKNLGYDGVFITNHFLDGSIRISKSLPYEEKLEFYVSDYLAGKKLEKEIGIKVFFGAELSDDDGHDFLVYGLTPDWFRAHPEIMEMKKTDELAFMRAEGGFVVHAHPFREAKYINHIRLYPRSVDAVEVINAHRTDFENHMAAQYAEDYGLLVTAGSDNHVAGGCTCRRLAGMECEQPLESEADYIRSVREGSLRIFELEQHFDRAEGVHRSEDKLSLQVHLRQETDPADGARWQLDCGDGVQAITESEEVLPLNDRTALKCWTLRPAEENGDACLRFRYAAEGAEPRSTFEISMKVKDGQWMKSMHDFL